MSDFGIATPAEMRPRAMKEARRALDIDAQSAEGYEALGRAQFLFDWNFVTAERSILHAVALDPDYMPAQQSLAWLASARGEHKTAIAAARRALQLDPVNIARYTELAWVLLLDGQYDDAMRVTERALQLSPKSGPALMTKGRVAEMMGQSDTAIVAYREGLRAGGVPDSTLRRIDASYRAEGFPGVFRNWLNTGGDRAAMPETFRAQLYARAGDRDRAIECLERAFRNREGALAWLNVEPTFQSLRGDPRFRDIAARVTASSP
jgi:tetratricopeptide (TPR) repeat protein